jgi:hypothetical protein
MTRPPNPKSAKVRKIKVWVRPDWLIPNLRDYGSCPVFRRRKDGPPRCVPATLLLPAKAKGKA